MRLWRRRTREGIPTTVEELFAEPPWLWRLKQLDEKLTGRRLRRIRKNDARRDQLARELVDRGRPGNEQ